MVYRKYIKKRVNGEWKTFGPYYYESYRDHNGIARTRYVPNYHPHKENRAVTGIKNLKNINLFSKKHLTLFLILGFAIFFVFGFAIMRQQLYGESIESFGDVGNSVVDMVKDFSGFLTGFATEGEEESEPPVETPASEPTAETSVSTTGEVTSEETPLSPPLEQPSGEEQETTEDVEENITEQPIEPETESNETVIEVTNETITTETNATISETTNVTVTEKDNMTIVQANITTSEENITITEANITKTTSIKQYQAKLGQPVKWEKKVKVDIEGEGTVNSLEIDLPKLAGDVSVKKITSTGEEELGALTKNEKTIAKVEPIIPEPIKEGIMKTVFNYLLNFFTHMTARVVDISETSDEVIVDVDEKIKDNEEIIVEYYTDAPYSEENVINNDTKNIIIIGPDELHYENILAFTYLEQETVSSAINLYHVIDGLKEVVEVNALDTNNNKLIDYVEWIVPSLSKQEYKLEIQRGEKKRVIIKMQNENSMDDFSAFGKKEKQFTTEKSDIGVREIDTTMIEYLKTNNNLISEIIEDQQVDLLIEESETIIRSIDVKNEFGLTGAGKKICILDTGVDNSVVSYDNGFDFVNNDPDASDDNGHGTEVAYVAKTIAPEAEILAAKVLDANGTGYESNVLEGLQWCIDNNANIISFSIGAGSYDGFCDTNIVAELANIAVENGIFVAAATGNDNSLNLKSPSCASKVTRVSATTKQDEIADFSNVNELVDLFAPGESIQTKTIGGSYTTKSGTSMSTPMVSGSAALLLENESLTPEQLKYRFRSTGEPISYALDLLTLINISRVDVYNAVTNYITMIPFAYIGNQSQGNETNQTYVPLTACGVAKFGGSGRTCNDETTGGGETCCNDAITICYIGGGAPTSADCVNCDTSSTTCASCCASSGLSNSYCTSTYYSDEYFWYSTPGACCGDDGAADDISSNSSTDGCCCDGTPIGTGNDAQCSGYSNYWCIDGYYCEAGSGLVKDTSLTASGTDYTLAGDDIVCGCDSSGDKCDTGLGDTTATGLCASSTCATTMVANNSGTNFVTTCASGYECDSDVTPTASTPIYEREGYCATTTCCYGSSGANGGGLMSGEKSNSAEDWAAGDETCGCSASHNNEICDDTRINGPTADGVCAEATAGSTYYCKRTSVACNNTDSNCLGTGWVFQDCANGRTCDSDVTDNGFERDGYCAGASCCTGLINSGEASQVAEDWSAGDESCTCVNHTICDSAASSGPTADGVCVNTACTTGLVGCNNTNTNCTAPYGTLYTTCDSTGALRYCDADIDTDGYVRDGVCGSTSCCTGLIASGESSGASEDWTGGDESCTCSNNIICDSSGLLNSNPDADGACVSTICDTSDLACSNTDAACSGGTLYASCATGRQGCESGDVGGDGYTREGHCGAATCCTSTIASGEISGADWTAGDEVCFCNSTGFICDTTAVSGPSVEGVCAGTSCTTSGAVCVNASYNYTATLTTCSANCSQCDSDITAPGVGYVRDGYVESGSCVLDETRTAGQACCINAQCDTNICTGGVCVAANTAPDINITFPINNTNTTNTGLDVNYTASDNVAVQACWYSNDSFTVNTSLTDCGTNITTIIWSDGQHNVTVWANDSAGLENQSSVTFRIDSTKPNILITFPNNNSNTSNTGLDINYTASDSGVGLQACWYSNDSFTVNTSLTNCATNITTVTWSEGQHNVTVWANDTLGNENQSRITFRVDLTKPNVLITSPSNNSNSSNTGLDVLYERSDITLQSCWYSNDTYLANTTLAGCANITTVTWSDMLHNVTVWVNDSVGNENSSTITFTIDTVKPNINITFPINNTNTTNTGLDVNYTVDSTAVSCWYSNDTYLANTSLTDCGTNITTVTWSDMLHNVTVWANDTFGNENQSRITFRVDTSPPSFTNWADQHIRTNQSLNYNIDAVDTGVGVESFAINWSSPFSIVTSTGVLTNTSGLSAGKYYINVSINDTLGNLNSSVLMVNVTTAFTTGELNVLLIAPTGTSNLQPQNQTFIFDANVTCVGSAGEVCGIVNGTAKYNLSALSPDTAIQGDGTYNESFYTFEPNPMSCGALAVGDNACNLTWTVNATGDITSMYRLAINFTSDFEDVISNETNYTIVKIIYPSLSLTLSDELRDVRFGENLNPGTGDNPATNNSYDNYNVTCSHYGGRCNVSIKGNYDMIDGVKIIGLGNITWNQVNQTVTEKALSTAYSVINATLGDALTQMIYFWLDLPNGTVAGDYQTNFTIYGSAN